MVLRRAAVALVLVSAVVIGSDPGGAQAVDRVGLNGDPCAYETIGDAIDDAGEGDIVFVSPGTYDETLGFFDFDLSIVGSGVTCSGAPAGGPTTVVVDGEGSGALTGGMAEVFEAELILRDLFLTDAMADADGGLLSVDGGILDLTRVFLFEGEAGGDGGAIAAVNDASVIVDDSFFFDNTADGDGGSIAIDGGSLIMQDVFVTGAAGRATAASPASADNGGLASVTGGAVASIIRTDWVNGRAGQAGGGLYVDGAATEVEITGGEFDGNFAEIGGAVDVGPGSSVQIDGADFSRNDAVGSSNVHVEAPADSPSATTVTLAGAQIVGGTGEGSVRAVGPVDLEMVSTDITAYRGSTFGAVDARTGASARITDSTISDNVTNGLSTVAGGLSGSETSIVLLRSNVLDNDRSLLAAGGISVVDSDFTALQSLIAGNEGHFTGGLAAESSTVRLIDVVIEGNTGGRFGGIAIDGSEASLEMDSSTILDNVVTNNAGLTGNPQAAGLDVADGVSSDVFNSIVWGSTGGSGSVDVDENDARWRTSIVEDSGGSGSWDPVFGTDLGGNLDIDPMLDDRWVPLFDSPARDVGDQFVMPLDAFDVDGDGDVVELLPADFAGRQRVRGISVDIGALERPDRQFVLDDRPCVIYDTFAATGSLNGPLGGGEVRTLRAAGTTPASQGVTNSCIPVEAEAGLFHVRAFTPQREGNFRLSAAGVVPNGGVVNFAALPTTSLSLENSSTVPSEFAFNGFIDLAANAGPSGVGSPTAGASIHSVGYFMDDIADTEVGLDFFPLTPCAVHDSRANKGAGLGFVGPFSGTTNYDIDVTGDHSANQGGGSTNCGVPESAEGVIVNLVAINPTGPGVLSAVSDGSVLPFGVTSYADLPMNNANSIVVPIADDGTISVGVGPLFGSVHIRAVVLGYVDDEPGLQFTPLAPCSAFDSRSNKGATDGFAGSRTSGSPTTYQIAGTTLPSAQGGENGGDCGVPDEAAFVLVNLVAINPVAEGNLRADATGSTPTGGVLNFALLEGQMNNSNTVPIALDELGRMDVFANGGPVPDGTPLTNVRGVILGFYD